MLKYYIKIALRNFQTNKVIFAGSLATLSLGALCISLLYTYIDNELSMNDFGKDKVITSSLEAPSKNQHKRQEDIYLMIQRDSPKSEWEVSVPSLYFGFDYKKYPELENIVRIARYKNGEYKFKYNSNKFYPTGLIVDSTFFKVFDYKLKFGNIKTALKNHNSVIISEKLAKNIFGTEDPLGKDIKIAEVEKGKFDRFFKVTGVIIIPSNSSMEFDFLIPSPKIKDRNKFNRIGGEFILTKKGFDFDKDAFIEKIKPITQNHRLFRMRPKLDLISLNEVYFNRELNIDYRGIFSKFGDVRNNNIIIIIMLIILIISVLNFSNLQIVNINAILKQIGIIKINGAKKRHLFYQKITEITVILLLALLCSTLLYQLVLPRFNLFFNIELAPSVFKILKTNTLILSLIAILSLIYPIITIYKLSPIASLKNKVSTSKQLIGKKVIAIIQYALTFVLLIVSVIVAKQLDLMLSKDLGIKSSNVINTKLFYSPPTPQNWKNLSKEQKEDKKQAYLNSHQYLKNELLSSPTIVSASQGTSLLKPFKQQTYKADNGSEDFTSQNFLYVTSEHLKVYDFEILEGDFFNLTSNDPEVINNNNTVIINEAAKKFWNISDITTTNILSNRGRKPAKIIGVVKDFNYEHLSAKPQPLIMFFNSKPNADFHIRFQEDRVQEGLQFVENLFKKTIPNETFSYTFLSDDIAALYQKEKRLSTIYILFTVIALLISAIGLFTIALYDTQQRTKEIGVRKVNGATITEIMLMLNKDFVKWVGIAFVIACPISYYAMSKWLENFAYKTNLSWWVFALAGVFTLVISLLTVSWQSYRAATRNPIEALRDE